MGGQEPHDKPVLIALLEIANVEGGTLVKLELGRVNSRGRRAKVISRSLDVWWHSDRLREEDARV